MRGMGRNRQTGKNLPKYVYVKRGWYVWRRDMLGQGSPIRLVKSDSPMSAVWAAWEAVQRDDRDTLSGLISDYIEAASVARRTRKDYLAMAEKIAGQSLADGRRLGEVHADEPTTQFWRQYLDKLSDTPVSANRRMQLIKAAYSWGFQRGRVRENTPKGVSLYKEQGRSRYVTDAEYGAVLDLARSWARSGRYPYLWVMMELAYLLRARRSEVCWLQRRQIETDRLSWARTKGSKPEITLITPRLKAALDAGKALESDIISPYIVHRRGQQIKKNAFDSAWRRLLDAALDAGLIRERFTFHDLKAKGVSDHKDHYGGHRSGRQAETYIRKPDEVEATR